MQKRMGITLDIAPVPRKWYKDIPQFAHANRFEVFLRVGAPIRGKPFFSSRKIGEALRVVSLPVGSIVGNVFFDLFHDTHRFAFANYEPIHPNLQSHFKKMGIGTLTDIRIFEWAIRKNPEYASYSISTGSGTKKERLEHILKRGRAVDESRTLLEELNAARRQAVSNFQRNRPVKKIPFIRRVKQKVLQALRRRRR